MFPITSTAPFSFSAPWQQLQDYGLEQWKIDQMQQTAVIPQATYWGGMEAPTSAGMYLVNTEGEGVGLGLGFGSSSTQGRQFWSVNGGGGSNGNNGTEGGGGWVSTADI